MATGGVQHPVRTIQQGGTEDQRWEDSWNGLPPMTGGRNTVGCGVRAMDDRRGTFVTGEAACLGTVNRLQGGDGARVSGISSTDAEWEGNKWETTFRKKNHWRGDKYLQDGLTN